MSDKAVTIGQRSNYPILDEDAMGSDSAVSLATQQSIKAYVDTRPVYAYGEIADVSTSGSSWALAPVAGTISAITTVIDGTIATADAVLSFELAGTAVTDGGITIAYDGSAAGDIDTATPSAANTVTAGQAIELITNGASSNAVKAVVMFTITPS